MLRFEVRPYRREFQRSLTTHHGDWVTREGAVVRLTDAAGRVGWGEIAPLPWFGTETLAAALAYCAKLGNVVDEAAISAIPDALPACQFGMGSALNALQHRPAAPWTPSPDQVCGLLPAGEAAIAAWPTLWIKGHHTLKWKIGVQSIAQEQAILTQVLKALPATGRLRLDANGGLTLAEAKQWLAILAPWNPHIEFLEQPLPPSQLMDLIDLARRSPIPIALDESIATVAQFAQLDAQCPRQMVFVVKPAIAGHPDRLQAQLRQTRRPVVFSSALETPIGRGAALALARWSWDHGIPPRPLGFGVEHWFADRWNSLSPEALWTHLAP